MYPNPYKLKQKNIRNCINLIKNCGWSCLHMMKHNFQVTDALLEVFVDLFEQVGATILCLSLRENPQETMDIP